jgi:hypothetical protein
MVVTILTGSDFAGGWENENEAVEIPAKRASSCRLDFTALFCATNKKRNFFEALNRREFAKVEVMAVIFGCQSRKWSCKFAVDSPQEKWCFRKATTYHCLKHSCLRASIFILVLVGIADAKVWARTRHSSFVGMRSTRREPAACKRGIVTKIHQLEEFWLIREKQLCKKRQS